jgi:hypothetical protein
MYSSTSTAYYTQVIVDKHSSLRYNTLVSDTSRARGKGEETFHGSSIRPDPGHHLRAACQPHHIRRLPLTAQIGACHAEAQDHGNIVELPTRERELRLATLAAAELEAIRAWFRDDHEQFQLLIDLHALQHNPQAAVDLQDILDHARFCVVSVTLWALAPLWVADGIRERVDAGPLPCSPSARA